MIVPHIPLPVPLDAWMPHAITFNKCGMNSISSRPGQESVTLPTAGVVSPRQPLLYLPSRKWTWRAFLPRFALTVLAAIAMNIGVAATEELDTAPVLQTKMTLRDAWVEHIFWIRNYVFATRGSEDHRRQVAEEEVVANAKVLAESIRPFYGEAASDQLFQLLAGHWGAVKAYNTATLNGSTSEQAVATEALSSNAHEIAQFLSGANPFLPEGAVFGLLSVHAAHHSAQIDEIEAGDYALEAATWNAMRQHMFTIADTITKALAQQFPGDFGIG